MRSASEGGSFAMELGNKGTEKAVNRSCYSVQAAEWNILLQQGIALIAIRIVV